MPNFAGDDRNQINRTVISRAATEAADPENDGWISANIHGTTAEIHCDLGARASSEWRMWIWDKNLVKAIKDRKVVFPNATTGALRAKLAIDGEVCGFTLEALGAGSGAAKISVSIKNRESLGDTQIN